MRLFSSARARLGLALGVSSLVSVGLFAAGALTNRSSEFAYLIWNLFLAWVPLGLTLWLERVLHTRLWSSWLAIGITLLWIGFLPNSFYMISDFIHIQEVRRVDLLYDVVMFSSFIFNGVILGFISLYMVHRELVRRVGVAATAQVLGWVLALCSFAIYIGRELRWNTWDVLLNPAGILVDVSNRVLTPSTYPQVAKTTLSFFVLLASLYFVTWCSASMLRQSVPQAPDRRAVRSRIRRTR
jgi:uncharacterized membrane protein